MGSDGRQEVGFETGGNNERFGYYINVSQYEEDGWRKLSPSAVKQAFTSLSFRGEKSHFDVNYMFADNQLTGNGAAPVELLEIEGRNAVYTSPDQTNNELHQLSGDGEYELSSSLLLNYNFFYRKIDFIIFDEAQHLIKGKNIYKENKIVKEKDKKAIHELSDWLKSGIDRWQIPVLFSGMEDLNVVFSANDQLERRLNGRLSFDQNQTKDKVARADWSHFLYEISCKLPFPEESNLAEPRMARALWIGSSMLRGRAARLIVRGAEISFENRDSHLTISSLSEAFIELANKTEKSLGNPFLEGAN